MNLPLTFNPTVVFVDCAAVVKLMMKTSCLDGEKIIQKNKCFLPDCTNISIEC